MENEIILYGHNTLRTLRVHWILNELSVPYQSVKVLPDSEYIKSDEYKKINYTGKIPSLKIDGIYLFESAAICLYLPERFGDKNIIPALGSIERAKLYQWCFYTMTELDAHTLYILSKHGGVLKERYGVSEVAVKTAKEGFETQITKAENELADGREFLMGDNFSVADILLGTCIESAIRLNAYVPLNIPSICIEYWERLKNREAFKMAFSLNTR
ncbi:MAG: glutathione S-transferase family protein [Deltaproteobacteria bacterium]|nr:glutathione S-transferase family protein [Deltaproteobacteria bacterium]